MKLERIHQQSAAGVVGPDRADSACLPTCFYVLARAYGYLDDVSFEDFMATLDWNSSYRSGTGWIRPRLSAELRRRYHLPIVSWGLAVSTDITPERLEAMTQAGYLGTQREIAWFETYAADWPIEVLVAAGTPVIATMKPGFAANGSSHAVILAALKDDKFEIIDPDERNPERFYSIDQVRRGLSPTGAASVILPKIH